MTSKKDYVAIAEILNREIRELQFDCDGKIGAYQALESVRLIAHNLSRYFADSNPQFDSERFLTAVEK